MEPLQISLNSNTPLPKYQSELASGIDVTLQTIEKVYSPPINAYSGEEVLEYCKETLDTVEYLEIFPQHRFLLGTGISLNYLDPNLEIQLRPRSSLALKYGLMLMNSPGTIDADYRGQIMVLLFNPTQATVIVNKGTRIAQLVVAPVVRPKIQLTESGAVTERGTGGFGSTGTH